MADVQVRTQPFSRDDLLRFAPNYRLIKTLEDLAQDVSTTIPEAIGASITGPATAVDNHVPVFEGTSGTEVRDSGVDIDDLAPLNSPAFTGVPTTPTPPPGDASNQIANTAFVQSETANNIAGPASATDNAIALFDGTTGKIIKDSAVLLTSLAPLASPGLTGNPTAPTTAAGDNDTSIATTAFVQGEFAARTALSASFSAHNNGTAQSIPNGAFTKLTLGTELFDVGSKFAGSTWTPPAGRPVLLTGTYCCAATVAGCLVTVAIYKNGVEFKRGVMQQPQSTGPVSSTVSIVDIPNGTDTYELWAFQNSGFAQNTVGNANLTHFQGTTIQA